MRVASFFSGIGGFDLGLERAGMEIVFQCEIHPFAQKVLKKHWPNVPLHADIQKLQADMIPDADLYCGGFPCFAAGTMILTIEGYKPIETLQVGELVLSHTGQWQKITSVMSRFAEKTISINGMGIIQTTTTHEHPYYVSERQMVWTKNPRGYKRVFCPAEWLEAGSLTTNHFMLQTLPQTLIQDEHSLDFWWLVGRYLADGWRVQRKNRKNAGRVVICSAYSEAKLVAEKIESAGFHASPVLERTVVKYHIVKNDLYHFLSQFGHKADGKTIPGWVLQLPPEKAESLLLGYLTGDGSRYNKAPRAGGWKCTTVSKSLALGIALLAQRAWEKVASVHEYNVASKKLIEGRTVSQKKQYQVVIADRQRAAFVEELYGYKQVKHITETMGAMVYNISVETDESYVANGAIVHNCQDLSLANQGKRKGLEGERSGLFFDFSRIIRARKPKWLLIENVPGLLNSHEGRDFQVVIQTLDEFGYGLAWRVLDTKHFGSPQRRRRVFIVASYQSLSAARVLFETPTSAIPSGTSSQPPESTSDSNGSRYQEPNLYTIQHASIGRKSSAGPQAKGYRNDGETWTLDSRGSSDVVCSTDAPFGIRESTGLSTGMDSARYRAIGNAVSVPIIEWIGKRILEVDSSPAEEIIPPKIPVQQSLF